MRRGFYQCTGTLRTFVRGRLPNAPPTEAERQPLTNSCHSCHSIPTVFWNELDNGIVNSGWSYIHKIYLHPYTSTQHHHHYHHEAFNCRNRLSLWCLVVGIHDNRVCPIHGGQPTIHHCTVHGHASLEPSHGPIPTRSDRHSKVHGFAHARRHGLGGIRVGRCRRSLPQQNANPARGQGKTRTDRRTNVCWIVSFSYYCRTVLLFQLVICVCLCV